PRIVQVLRQRHPPPANGGGLLPFALGRSGQRLDDLAEAVGPRAAFVLEPALEIGETGEAKAIEERPLVLCCRLFETSVALMLQERTDIAGDDFVVEAQVANADDGLFVPQVAT